MWHNFLVACWALVVSVDAVDALNIHCLSGDGLLGQGYCWFSNREIWDGGNFGVNSCAYIF